MSILIAFAGKSRARRTVLAHLAFAALLYVVAVLALRFRDWPLAEWSRAVSLAAMVFFLMQPRRGAADRYLKPLYALNVVILVAVMVWTWSIGAALQAFTLGAATGVAVAAGTAARQVGGCFTTVRPWAAHLVASFAALAFGMSCCRTGCPSTSRPCSPSRCS